MREGGKPDLATRLSQGYYSRVLARATNDKDVCQAVLEVKHLLKRPITLLRIELASGVYRVGFRGGRRVDIYRWNEDRETRLARVGQLRVRQRHFPSGLGVRL